MGKIVKSARIAEGRYLVEVPRDQEVVESSAPVDEDARFAEFHASSDGGVEAWTPAPPPRPEIDWEALRRDADAIIDAASSAAESMLREAHANAAELIAQAQERVVDLETEARAQGHEDGVIAGRTAVESEMAAMIATLRELIESARAQRHELIDKAEPELVKLAMAIAERVVHQHIAIEPTVIVENVRGALSRLVNREVVTLRLHPVDLDMIRQYRDTLVASNDVEHLRIVEDQRVDRGGVVLETDAGTIDAKIATQLREARKALATGDSIELGPSGDEVVLHSPAQAS